MTNLKENIFSYYWGAVLVTVPLFLSLGPNVSTRWSKNIFLAVCILIATVWFGLKKTQLSNHLMILCLATFTGMWTIFSSGTMVQFLGVCLGSIAILLVSSNTKNENIIYNAIAIGVIIQSAWVLLNLAGFDPYTVILSHAKKVTVAPNLVREGFTQPIVGSLGNRTVVGSMLALSFPVLLNKRLMVFIPMVLWAVYLCGSAMTWISLACGVAVFFLAQYIKQIYIGAMLVVGTLASFLLLVLPLPNGGAMGLSQRGVFYDSAMAMLSGSFLFGRGVGFFHDKHNLVSTVKSTYIHHEFLEALLAYGVVGFIFLLFLAVVPCLSGRRLPRVALAIWAATLASSTGHFTFHISSTAVIGLTAYGILTKYYRSNHGFFKH